MKHLFTTLTAALAINLSTNAQNCMGDWQYAIPIEINNSCSDTLTDYQVILSVATDSLITNGKLQANGEDLRFTMGGCCNALCCNIESGINTNSTLVVVKIPQLLPWDTVTLNMHYGNNAAVAADDPNCVYDFWDDFNDSNFDLTKWETRGNPTVTEGGGTLTLISNSNWGYCRSLVNFSGRTLIRESRRVGAGTSNGNVIGFTGTDFRHGFIVFGGNLGTIWDDDVTGGANWYNQTYPAIPAPGNNFVDYSIDMEINQSNQMRIHEYCNTSVNNCNSNITDLTQFTGPSFYVGYTSWSSGHYPVIDWIYVTKSNDTIPTYSFQSEVTVTPGPISLGNDTVFCQGDSLTLSPNGSWQTYTWNTSDTTPSITVSSTGNYSVTVTNEIGCDIVDTVDVTVNPLPDATFTSSNTGTTYDFTNTETAGSTWEWDFGDGDTSSAQNPTHTYGSEGTFVVCLTVTDTNGCQSTHCDSVDAQFPSGINNTTKVVSMQAYPNPANENLNLLVELSNNSKIVIELTALDGRVVKQLHSGQLQSGTNNLQLNLSGVANGSYILQLQQQNGETTNTIINKQ